MELQENLVSFNEEDFDRYFEFLSSDEKEIYCYCWMDKESKGPITTNLYGTSRTIKETPKPVDGATLHIVLNQTNMSGRKTRSDIQSVRAFCLDIDKITEKEKIKELRDTIHPQMIVESSPGKYHFYWKCSPKVTLELWSTVQAGLAHKYGGDRSLSQVNHMIRVPGIKRVCKDGNDFVPLVYGGDEGWAELAYEDILKDFGEDILEEGKKAFKAEKLHLNKLSKEVQKFLKGKDRDPSAVATLIGEGERNKGIYTITNDLVFQGGLNGEGPKVNLEEAYAFAWEVNSKLKMPLSEEEVEKTVRSAWKKASESLERKASKHGDAINEEKQEVNEDAHSHVDGFQYDYTKDEFLSENRFTDRAVLERLIQRYGTKIIRTGELLYAFDDEAGVWERQKPDKYELLDDFAAACAYDTIHDPEFIDTLCTTSAGEHSKNKQMIKESEFCSHGKIAGTVRALFKRRKIQRKLIKDFDCDPNKLFVGNGVLNILTGEIRKAKPDDFLLVQTPIKWDETADCPKWKKFLGEVFLENDNPAEMVDFMQQLFGYSLTGRINEEKLFVYIGEGSNGKSKTLKALYKLMGENYGALLSCQKLNKSRGALQGEFDRIGAKIEGKRVVIIDDLDTKTQWNEGFIKSLTGDTIVSRKLYAEERDIPNRSKFHIGCNNIPEPETTGKGMTAVTKRICIIPFAREFELIPSIGKQIDEDTNEELSGILKWAVEGAQKVHIQGGNIKYPGEVGEEETEYKGTYFKTDSILTQILTKNYEKENSVTNTEKWSTVIFLRSEITEMLRNEGVIEPGDVISERALGRRLIKMGYDCRRIEHQKGVKTRYYNIKRKKEG